MRFEARQLPVQVTALAEGPEGLALFVRFSAPDGDARAYLDDPRVVREALARARQDGRAVSQVVVVGADALFEPRSEATPGREAALVAFGELLRALCAERIPFVWRTRGGVGDVLPGALSEALIEAGRLGTVEVGIPTLDEHLCRALEGGRGASPEERLRLMSAASARGVPVRALLDPLVPMLSDQSSGLKPLLRALVDAGVHRVSVRYLVLTRARAKQLTRRLSRMNRDLIRGLFADEPWRTADETDPTRAAEPHKLIPPRLRRLGHQRVEEIAAGLGLAVDVLDAATEEEELTRNDRVERRDAGRQRLRARGGGDRPQLDLFSRRTG